MITVLLTLLLVSCTEEPPKDYAVVHGKIENALNDRNFRLFSPELNRAYEIPVHEDGTFRDTLKLEKGTTYTAMHKNIFTIYLKNGMDLEIDFDTENPKDPPVFSGEGKVENEILIKKRGLLEDLIGADFKIFLSSSEEDFNKALDSYSKEYNALINKNIAQLDTAFVSAEQFDTERLKQNMLAEYEKQQEINVALGTGKKSPLFMDYINYKGGTTSLEDLKGKYTYIDVWATWCAPCKVEIPYLKEIEHEYADKNINFVSLSIDKPSDEDKWREFIEEEELGGIQLLADAEAESQFIRDYYIMGIPRFILLDPELNIIDYDAPRPSEPKLKEVLDSLNL